MSAPKMRSPTPRSIKRDPRTTPWKVEDDRALKRQAEFPIDALGKTLDDAARAIAKIIQCPLSTAAGLVLAAIK